MFYFLYHHIRAISLEQVKYFLPNFELDLPLHMGLPHPEKETRWRQDTHDPILSCCHSYSQKAKHYVTTNKEKDFETSPPSVSHFKELFGTKITERERENIFHTCVPTYGLLGSITSLKFKREQSLHIYWV